MMRRNARLRREYLYRKSLEGKEKELYEKKQRIREAIEEGTRIPTELREEEAKLREDLAYEDNDHKKVKSHIDDEYARAGVEDPRILITTSRSPSSKLQQFAKELKLVFPNAKRINRGNYVTKVLVDTCRNNDITDLVVVHEHRGVPDGLVVSHLPYGPTAYFGLHNVVMRHDIEGTTTVSEQFPHLIFDGFSTNIGERVTSILKYLFPVPKEESKRVMTFRNDKDFISFRHHVYDKVGPKIALREVGPRFELRLYQIRLGTLEQTDADTEWVLRPYMNTAAKKNAL